jgi:CRISPR system Cascade subunit CasA
MSFHLIDEPWILVRRLDGSCDLLSLRQIFAQCAGLRTIGGDIPTQSFAIMRMLLAVVRRAVVWGPDPVARWVQIWRAGDLPADEIEDYLHRVHSRFDLLDPETPFYQVADLTTRKGEFKPVELLLTDVPTGEKFFTTRAGAGAQSLTLPEAARWVVHCQCYDIAGIKSADPRDPRGRGGKGFPVGVGWAGQLGGIIFEGASVFHTLMLNTVAQDSHGNGPDPEDLPVWERPHPDHLERAALTPTGPADLLTWQSRRIRLIADGQRVVNVLVTNGDPISSHNRWRQELMAGWRYSEPQSRKFGDDRYLPVRWDEERALWRGIAGMLADVRDSAADRDRFKASGTAHWLSHLLDEEHLDADTIIRPHAYGLTYINQAATVGAAVDDTVLMRVALLGRDSQARVSAVAAVDAASAAVRALGSLAARLAVAAGGAGDEARVRAEAAAYFALDGHYRSWLKQLHEPGGGAEEFEAVWQRTVSSLIRADGNNLIAGAGEPAWVGRLIDGSWLNTAVAERLFRGALRKALPYAHESTTENGVRHDQTS